MAAIEPLARYPHLSDDWFVRENLDRWMSDTWLRRLKALAQAKSSTTYSKILPELEHEPGCPERCEPRQKYMLHRVTFVVLLIASFVPILSTDAARPADLVLLDGRVLQVDDQFRTVTRWRSATAIRGGRIE